MIINQSSLIADLKNFLHNLSKEEYELCRKAAQLFKKTASKKQWSTLAYTCTQIMSKYKKQNKKLQEQNITYLNTVKKRAPQGKVVEKLKNGIVVTQEFYGSNRQKVFYYLQGGHYEQAFRQSKKQYCFLNHLREYYCLLKIWESMNEVKINQTFVKSEFYYDVKKMLIKDAKAEQQFKKYVYKICYGQRLQPYQEPQYLSKRFYEILVDLQQKIKNPLNYYQGDQFEQNSDIDEAVIKIMKKIYRQFFERQFNPQTFGKISLIACMNILRNDLKNWKQKRNHQKYLNQNQNVQQSLAKMESLLQRNEELEKSMSKTTKDLMEIINTQICIEDFCSYPLNEKDTQEIINCLTLNTQKLGQFLQKQIKSRQNLQKQLKKQTSIKQSKNKNSQFFDEQEFNPTYRQKMSQYQQKITQLQKKSKDNDSLKKQIENLSRKLDYSQQNLQKSQKQLKNTLLELAQSQQRINKFQSKLKKQTDLIKLKQLKQNQLFLSISVLKEQKRYPLGLMQSNLSNQFTNFTESNNDSAELQKFKAIIQDMNKKQSQMLQKYNKLQKETSEKEFKLIESHKRQIERQKNRFDKLKIEYNELQQIIDAHQKRIQQTQQINIQLEEQRNSIRSQSQILQIPQKNQNDSNNTLSYEIQLWLRNEIDTKQKKIKKYQQQKIELKKRIIQLEDKYKKQLQDQQNRIQLFKQTQRQIWQKIKKDLDIQRQRHKATKQQLDLTKSQIIRINQESQYYSDINQTLTKQITLLKTAEPAINQSSAIFNSIFFNSKGIFEDNQKKQYQYLIKTLESRCGKILKTKLLYYYDPLNKTNFHRYVDNHKNIVVIVKTLYGKLIAGFSQSQINPRGVKLGFGLLMSLWKQLSWQIIPEKRPVTYDDYYIIFGNSQIRLRSQQDKIFSNFGISNGFFNAGKSKIEDLLGQRERQTDITSYEFYEVIFSQ